MPPLPRCAEGWPVARDPIIQRQRGTLGEHVHGERYQGLARGEQEKQRVRLAAERLVEHNLPARDDADLRGTTPFPYEVDGFF